MTASALAAFTSVPAFWSNGYGLPRVGQADLPLGAITAGINGLTTFVFLALVAEISNASISSSMSG